MTDDLKQVEMKSNDHIGSNSDWLKKNSVNFQGQWVALRNGEVQGVANSLESLEIIMHLAKGVEIIKVP